jgi:hypothetical protein
MEKVIPDVKFLELDNLSKSADLLADQKNFSDAFRLYEKALNSREVIYGLNHIDTLNVVYIFAIFLTKQDKKHYKRSEELFNRAMEGFTQYYGSAKIVPLQL